MSLEANKDVIRTYLDKVLTGGDVSALNAIVCNEDLKRRVKGFWQAFGDRLIDPHAIIAEGDSVATHISMQANHVGAFRGIEATNKRVNLTCTAMFRLENGKITDYMIDWDWLRLIES